MKQLRHIFAAVLSMVFVCGSVLAMSDFQAGIKFHQAAEFYNKGEYPQAIGLYEEIISQNLTSGAVYFNLGNSYFRQGQLGKAVLNYERAKTLIPRDSDLNFNYNYALSKKQQYEGEDKISLFHRLWQQHSYFYTADEMGLIILVLAAVFCLSHMLSLYLKWKKPLKAAVFCAVLLIMVVYVFGLAYRINYFKDLSIVSADCESRFEPQESSTVHFRLFEGTKVKWIKKENGWVKVRRQDGKMGWILENQLEII